MSTMLSTLANVFNGSLIGFNEPEIPVKPGEVVIGVITGDKTRAMYNAWLKQIKHMEKLVPLGEEAPTEEQIEFAKRAMTEYKTLIVLSEVLLALIRSQVGTVDTLAEIDLRKGWRAVRLPSGQDGIPNINSHMAYMMKAGGMLGKAAARTMDAMPSIN